MLLRFSVTNHLSIKDEQELLLTASPLKDNEAALIDCPAAGGGRMLPAVVIYGANASGKSNFIEALRFMQTAVLASHSQGEPGSRIPRKPFALDPDNADTPSVFDADFVFEGVRYRYGFEATDKAFVAEWLYAFPHGKQLKLFERGDQSFSFGRELKGRKQIISELTRPNSLFISAAAQNDHDQLSKIAKFFRSMSIDTTISVGPMTVSSELSEEKVDGRVIEFLARIGTGVTGYRIKKDEVSQEQLAIREKLNSALESVFEGFSKARLAVEKVDSSIQLSHEGTDGKDLFFDIDSESAGTRRLLIMLGKAFHALDNGAPYVMDELDASLHTQACEAILALFSSPETNPHGAQLIATTHDTNLLRSPLLRRDQVWFTEKNDEGATRVYPLTDIRTRKGDNIARGYLQGRYGAAPIDDPISDFMGAD